MLTPVTYPWNIHSSEWTEESWLDYPALDFPIEQFRPTQEGISLKAMARILEEPDDFQFIGNGLLFEGQILLINGHHHWIRDLLRGKETFRAYMRDWKECN